MGIAWIILFPTGAAIIRLFKDRFGNPMAVHRALQIANTVLVVLAMILGIAASGINGTVRYLSPRYTPRAHSETFYPEYPWPTTSFR